MDDDRFDVDPMNVSIKQLVKYFNPYCAKYSISSAELTPFGTQIFCLFLRKVKYSGNLFF
jgi:hypothetical protein